MKHAVNILIICFFLVTSMLKAQQPKPLQPLLAEVRESFIQNALQLRKDENFYAAIQQLDSIIANNASDAQVLLFKGDLLLQSKRFGEAVLTYQKLLPLKYEITIVRISLSYALFMNHHPAKALSAAKDAWEQNRTNTNAVVNYFNAMLWNIKVKEAGSFLQAQRQLLSNAQAMVLDARLYTTGGNYKKGLHFYDTLVKSFPDKYYAKEYAEVLLGKKEFKQAEETMKSREQIFTKKEYTEFRQKVNATKMQQAGTEFVYFKDVAKNVRIENNFWWQQGEGNAYRFGVKTGLSKITSILNEKTNAQFVHVTINERWSKSLSGQTDFHLQRIEPTGIKAFTGLTGRQTIQYQPNDRRMIGVFYGSEILNFTASLLEKNIRSDDFGYVTHILLSGKNGFYSQGSFGMLNDNNNKYQFFGSLYHLFRTEPTLKGGFNFSALHYKDSTIKTYFSPNTYLSTEIFADYSTALPNQSKFFLQLQGGIGTQKIEQQQWQPNYRFQADLQLRLNRLVTSLRYQTSNVASSTGTGYKFNWYTLAAVYKFK